MICSGRLDIELRKEEQQQTSGVWWVLGRFCDGGFVALEAVLF